MRAPDQMTNRDTEAYRRALAAFQDGRLDAARQHLEEALTSSPEDPRARHLAGVIALTTGALAEAERHFGAAVRCFPSGAEAAASWVGLGRARLPAGRLREALSCFRRAAEIAPGFGPAYSGQAAACCDLGDYRSAEDCARKALQIEDEPRTRLILARALMFQSRIDEAEQLLQDLATTPDVGFQARFHQAGCAVAHGRGEEAEGIFRALLRERPTYPGYLELAKVKRFCDAGDPDIAQMRKLLASMPEMPPAISDILRADVSFALAKAYDDLECFDVAFPYLREANSLRAKQDPFDSGDFERRADAILDVGRRLLRHPARGASGAGPAPLVIAALPRSGSTLLEQMLCGHSKITAGGEFSPLIPVLDGLLDDLAPGRRSDDGGEDPIERARRRIAEALIRQDSAVRYVSDKSPVGFLYAGVLCGIQENARVIFLRRHPLDTALSQYMQSFARGLGWTYTLDAIAKYHAVFGRVMEEWRETMGHRIVEVDYEALVHDAPRQLGRILDFCGLAWDPACLDFKKRDRAVVTASGVQVREPLTRRSIGKWRCYETYLVTLRESLESAVRHHEDRLRRQAVPFPGAVHQILRHSVDD